MVRQNDKKLPEILPDEPKKRLPLRVETALAVMQMGISDYPTIASCAGLTEQEVKHIDLSEDRRIRQLGVGGVSPEKQYRLLRPLRCPKCRGMISIAPCVVCS